MTQNGQLKRRRLLLLWAVLVLVVSASVLFVAIPVWIIQPFKPQTQSGLQWSFLLRRWSPLFTVTALLVAISLIVFLWRNSERWWRKALLVVALLPLLVATWFARQNHFEWMFNPLERPAYAKANDVDFLSDSDIVLAVTSGGEAAAYPIRLMAYHHLVHDVVGGTPIVATY